MGKTHCFLCGDYIEWQPVAYGAINALQSHFQHCKGKKTDKRGKFQEFRPGVKALTVDDLVLLESIRVGFEEDDRRIITPISQRVSEPDASNYANLSISELEKVVTDSTLSQDNVVQAQRFLAQRNLQYKAFINRLRAQGFTSKNVQDVDLQTFPTQTEVEVLENLSDSERKKIEHLQPANVKREKLDRQLQELIEKAKDEEAKNA